MNLSIIENNSNLEFKNISQVYFPVINILYGDPILTYCKYIATNYLAIAN